MAAIQLYMDIIQLFLNLLQIIGYFDRWFRWLRIII
jgi:FtsH-binding integral membrane protein